MSSRRCAAQARRPVDLTLQGGGAHGAFTWDVLDCLLEERSLVIAGVSGTGAITAVHLGHACQGRVSIPSLLHGLGREAAGHWLEIHGADLGRRSTVDLAQEFLQ